MNSLRSSASRQNGAKSRGPISAAGRARSSQNALKLGIFSQKPILSDESETEFKALLEALIAELAPEGILETEYVYQVATVIWRKRRLQRAEVASIGYEQMKYQVGSTECKWIDVSSNAYSMIASISDEELSSLERQRDELSLSMRSVPGRDEKFSRMGVALDRELDRALKGLREAQALRRSALDAVWVDSSQRVSAQGTEEQAEVVDIDSEPISGH
jgi:hypothetical protein